jgi:NAD-dependent SIR2 family protein deacetylase
MGKRTRRRLEECAEGIVENVRSLLADATLSSSADQKRLRRRLWKRLWDDERAEAESRVRERKHRAPGVPEPRRIVVFLGAGASVPLGYPATNDLLPAIWDGLASTDKWSKWAGFRRMRGKHRIPIRKNRNDLCDVLRSILPGLADAGPTLSGASIVDVISMLEHCIAERHSPMEPPYLGKTRDSRKRRRSRKARSVRIIPPASQLIHARHLLTMALNGVLQGLKRKDITEDLARWMLSRSRQSSESRVTLVSTNYDAAVEQSLFDLVAKGSDQRKLQVARLVDFGFTWRDVSGNRHGYLPDARLAVFKLHGSLNWLRCETCGHVTVNTTERIVSLDAWQVQNQYNSCECGGLLKSLLVTPSIVRNIRDPSLLAIWNAALEDLRLADQWIFIGYSLPSEDVAIRSLLLRAFHTRKERKRLSVQVVSFETDEPAPPPTPQAAFRMFFPRSHFPDLAYESGGVEEFVHKLSRMR